MDWSRLCPLGIAIAKSKGSAPMYDASNTRHRVTTYTVPREYPCRSAVGGEPWSMPPPYLTEKWSTSAMAAELIVASMALGSRRSDAFRRRSIRQRASYHRVERWCEVHRWVAGYHKRVHRLHCRGFCCWPRACDGPGFHITYTGGPGRNRSGRSPAVPEASSP